MSGAMCFMWCLPVTVCRKDVYANCHDALLQIPSGSIRNFRCRNSYMSIILWKILRTESVKSGKQYCGGSVWYGAGKGMCMWFLCISDEWLRINLDCNHASYVSRIDVRQTVFFFYRRQCGLHRDKPDDKMAQTVRRVDKV